jgi:hypothetical protein
MNPSKRDSCATPGMINLLLKPISKFTETPAERNTGLMPMNTVTKSNIGHLDDNEKPSSRIPPYDAVSPLITGVGGYYQGGLVC